MHCPIPARVGMALVSPDLLMRKLRSIVLTRVKTCHSLMKTVTSGLKLKFRFLKRTSGKRELVKSLGKSFQHSSHSLLFSVSGHPCTPMG